MEKVYLLWHSHPTGANEYNEKLIGVYATQEAAISTQNRLRKQFDGSSANQELVVICAAAI
jgi:hypothetical protein